MRSAGCGAGKLGKQFAKRNLYNNAGNEQIANKYYYDYIDGLNDYTNDWREFSRLKMGDNYGGSGKLFDSNNPRHVAQAEMINKYNPANDNYHTWIRNADDIYDFEDTLKSPQFDPDFVGNDFDPSYSWDMAQDALKNGEIDVYSSYPIDKGIFVTPSQMEAASYSGTGKIYNKRVPLQDVAWIDPTQGQYAPVENKLYDYIQEAVNKEHL